MTAEYVYVASSWRNPIQPDVCARLAALGIEHYDFRNPPGGTGFSWKQVHKEGIGAKAECEHCGHEIVYGIISPEFSDGYWYHTLTAGQPCPKMISRTTAAPKKGTDWEPVGTYLDMIAHPRAIEGFEADFGARQRADTIVMILPCGKSAHLELGWACGAGKRTAILLEDPVEPELMYRMVDHFATTIDDLISWVAG